jgi:hypothetical protein
MKPFTEYRITAPSQRERELLEVAETVRLAYARLRAAEESGSRGARAPRVATRRPAVAPRLSETACA